MILVFAGAGASKAVNPESYPTTVEFFERLPDSIIGDPLFVEALNFLHQDNPEIKLDIEVVLSVLAEITESMENIADEKNIGGWMLAPTRIRKLLPSKQNTTPLLNDARNLRAQSQKLISNINSQVYNLYSKVPNLKEIESTWIELLRIICDSSERVELVTTNYDVVLEAAIREGNLPFDTGRTKSEFPTLNMRTWQMDQKKIHDAGFVGRLTKLHGSVDWIRDEEVIRVGNPMYLGNHDQHAILYPGVKNSNDVEPFRMYHRFLERIVREAKLIIFIGFAFRDDHVNQIMRENFPASCNVFVVDPVEIELPFNTKGVNRTNQGFSSTTAKQLKTVLPK